MGRKGMKGFMKTAARPSTKPEDEQAEQQDASATSSAAAASQPAAAAAKPAAAPAAAAAAAAPPSAAAAAADAAGSDEDGEGESRSKMLQRHKKELLAHRKAVQRMGKKSKEEIAKLDADLAARHAQELQALDAAAAAAAAAAGGSGNSTAAGVQQVAAAADGSAAAADKASKYLRDLSVGEGEEEGEEAAGKGKKLSKAQRRREKAAAKDAEREARIAAELAELGPSERATEEASLQALLAPLGLGIKEIRADGHCLYRSLEDQLEQQAAAGSNGSSEQPPQQQYNYQELRELAADYIRQHKEQFAPFLLPEDEDQDPEEFYEQYCYTLETTAAWGGHLELTALSAALQRPIRVHAVGMDTISLGETDYPDKPALEVCYLRHAFGLGEHYNSTKRQLFGAVVDDQEEEDEEAQEEAAADGRGELIC